MLKYFISFLLISTLWFAQQSFAEPNKSEVTDLTNDLLQHAPDRMKTNSTNATLSFDVIDTQAALLPEQESVYPIEFDQTIDVLVVHSPQLPELSIQESIDHVIDLYIGLDKATAALERSGVTGSYRVLDIVEQSLFDDKLTQAYSNAPEIVLAQNESNETQYLYQQSGADFILNIANTPRVLAGIASNANLLGTSGDDLNKLIASYPVLSNIGVLQESLSGPIIGHEFGHTLGLRHDRESFPESSLNDNFIAYGFTDEQRRFSSLMAATGCLPQNCKKSFYSSPDIFEDGVQMGVDESQTNAANAAKAVRATFQHSAYFNSRFQSANTLWEKTEDGFLLDWPDVVGADHYLLVPLSCVEFDLGFFVDLLVNAVQISQSSALIQNLQHDTEICIVAEKNPRDNQGISRMLLGGTQLFVSDEHIKLDSNLVRLSDDSTELSIGFKLSDASIDNESLILSLFYFAQSNINENWFDENDFEAPQMQAVLDAIMDYAFSGEGTTRRLTISLKIPFTQINDAFTERLELPQIIAPLRLRVGYLNKAGLPISSHFAINDSMPATLNPKLVSFPKRIENQVSTQVNFVVENTLVGASISLLPEDGLIVEDTNFEFIQLRERGRTHVNASVRTESDLEDMINLGIMVDGLELSNKLVIIPGPVNQLPSLGIEVGSSLSTGADVVINSNANDTDGFIEQYRWSSESGPSLSGAILEAENLIIPNAEAGEYRVNLIALDNNGSFVQESISFTVGQNTSSPEPNSPTTQSDAGGGALAAFSIVFLFWLYALRIMLASRAVYNAKQ